MRTTDAAKQGWLTTAAAAMFVLVASAAGAAELAGVTLPDTTMLGGTTLHLNGIALRTYSWLRIRIYVAGLYLEHSSHDAEAVLASPEKKMVVFRFMRDVDAVNARKSWREGFEQNCQLPCRLVPADVERFLEAVPSIRVGDRRYAGLRPRGPHGNAGRTGPGHHHQPGVRSCRLVHPYWPQARHSTVKTGAARQPWIGGRGWSASAP